MLVHGEGDAGRTTHSGRIEDHPERWSRAGVPVTHAGKAVLVGGGDEARGRPRLIGGLPANLS